MSDGFETKIPSKLLPVLLSLGNELGFDPTGSSEAETFFAGLITRFRGAERELPDWLKKELANSFNCIGQKPDWIQNPNWAFTPKGPMIFVGQINLPPGLFHDEAAFYVFYEPQGGLTKTILQVA